MDGDGLKITRDDEGVTFAPEVPSAPEKKDRPHDSNIAVHMSEENRHAISETMTENVAFDEEGMSGVEDIAEEVTDLMGLAAEGETDTEDEYGDTSSHTLMLTAVMRFQAKALAALMPAGDMAVRTEPVEDLDAIEDQKKRAEREEELSKIERRVQEFYTDYLFQKLPSYEDDTDQILQDMGTMGLGLRKVVVDRSRKSTPVMPEYVRPGDLIVSYDTRNFRTGRITHKMDLDTGTLVRRMNSGMYRPVKLIDQSEPEVSRIQTARDEVYGFQGGHQQQSSTHRIYEIYDDLFLKDDPHPMGLPRPYIVTIHAQSREILSVRRNWQSWDEDESAMEHFVGYLYHPGRSAVTGVGLGQILLQTTKSLRKAQRRMLEAGYLQNHPSGFKMSNLSIRDGETKVRAGEFVDVDTPTGDIRNALMLHPFQGPSQGLMALSQSMLENGRELGGIATVDFSQLMKSGVAAGPAMAAFEESTEFQTAVHRRLYKAQRKELEIIHDRMKTIKGDGPIVYGADRELQNGDLKAVDILPFMKPGQASKQKSIMEAQAVWDLAQQNPDILNKRLAAEGYIRALGSPEADRLIIDEDEQEQIDPADAVTEYVKLLGGQPLRAGLSQNHQAHIDSHSAQLKMLQTSQIPVEQGDAASAVLAAHISEHMGLHLMVEVASRTGIPVEDLGPDMPPEMEAKIAPVIAEAMQEIEKLRRPPEGQDNKLQIEQIKQQGQTAREQMKLQGKMSETQMKAQQEAELLALKHQHEKELREMQDDASMDREIEDNAIALRIARMKAGGSVNAGARAGNTE